jgi:hypothetical protein
MTKRLLSLLLLTALFAMTAAEAAARTSTADPGHARRRRSTRSPTIVYFDDMESGEGGWSHHDNTSGAATKFHLDQYYAYEGSYSWWCGEQSPSFSGGDGYGNGWDQRLAIPPVDLSAATNPFLEFHCRYDSEPDYDVTVVEAESAGVYVPLNRHIGQPARFDGVEPWGRAEFYLGWYDDPFVGRFRFTSDGAWSDEDGLYVSDGGAFHVDNIRVYDYYSGATLFWDDGESGGLCVPHVPAAAGDWWHIVDRPCAAYSDPHCWWCGDDADTGLVPPNLANSLTSPPIDLTGAIECTLRFLLHSEVPTDDNDYWVEEVSTDGGATWTSVGAWWGDFEQCSGWGAHGINGIDLTPFLPGTAFHFRVTFYTTEDGCGPGVAGGAGIALDDVWIEDWSESAVEQITWGRIKAMYRG